MSGGGKREAREGEPAWQREALLAAAIAVFAAVILRIDLGLELGIAGGVPYIGPVCLSYLSRRRWLTWAVAAGCSALVVVGWVASPPGAEPAIVAINRSMALAALWLVALLCHVAASAHGELIVKERHARSILDSALDAVVAIDASGSIIDWNPQAEAVFGWKHFEVRGRSIAELIIPPAHREAHRAGLRRFLETGEGPVLNQRLELTALRRSGEEFPVELTIAPLGGGDGGWRFSAFLRDITVRREAEEERARLLALEHANEELEAFAYAASHDLRAPLRAIRNLVQWLRDDLGERVGAESAEHLDLLTSRVVRMDQLLEGLLKYARIGRGAVAAESVDVGALVEEVAQMLAPPPGFAVVADGPMPTFETVRIALEQVLLNLVGNAIKHHDRADGRVQIRCQERDAHHYLFEVSDDGPGIPPEFHAKVFQLFQTLKSRDDVEGSGMGLALVRKHVMSAGGSIALRSGDGRGATFQITWPKRWPAGDA